MLAIGGVGGLAVGLAGREILENLFTGLIILSSSPFEVGDEVLFTPPSGSVRLFCPPLTVVKHDSFCHWPLRLATSHPALGQFGVLVDAWPCYDALQSHK